MQNPPPAPIPQTTPLSEVRSNAEIDPCLTVVMPVYNEAPTVAEIVSLVLAQRPVLQLVIVDDCSADGTWDKLLELSQTDVRITIIDPKGTVLADSSESLEQIPLMDNHATRPEVAIALREPSRQKLLEAINDASRWRIYGCR